MKRIYIRFSKRYPLLSIITISLCIIAVITATMNSISAMHETSLEYSRKTTNDYIESASVLLHQAMKGTVHRNPSDAVYHLIRHSATVFTAFIIKPTENDRHFTIIASVKGASLLLNTVKTDTSKESLIRKGLSAVTVNTVMETQGTISYIESYIPLQIGGKPHCLVIQWLSPHIVLLQQKHDAIVSSLLITAAAVIAATILIVAVLSLLHSHRIKSLLHELSNSMQSIASGTPGISLNESTDSELRAIAVSFNTLAEEMKNKNELLQKNNTDVMADIFQKGVLSLKDLQFDEAAALFTVITLYKPNSFAGHFNLGICFAKMGQFQKSLDYFTKAHAINPDNEYTTRYIEKIKSML